MIGETKIDMISLMDRAEQLHHRRIKAKCELIALAGGKVCYLKKEQKRIYWVEFDTEEEAVLFKLTQM
jgi:hypothetical protein